ncbi:pentatricopeptide repeat-containing protein, partial [Tanacetum coccineum]
MLCSGIRPVELTYASVFKKTPALEEGRQVHADCFKRGMDSDVYVRNTMIHFYASCKKIVDARNVFDEMQWKSVVSWNSIISGFVRVSWFYEAVEYFLKMRRTGVEGDGTTMVVMLSVCAEIGNLSMGKCVHTQIVGVGLEVS